MPSLGCLSLFHTKTTIKSTSILYTPVEDNTNIFNQTHLLQQLAKFVAMNKGDEKLPPFLTKGCCYAFSICHGAMDLIGKLDWWYSALTWVATWDGQSESLNQYVYLPNSTSSPGTLRTVFNRVLNYVVFHQIDYLNKNQILNISALNIFKPHESLFEIYQGEHSSPKTIVHEQNAAGYFTNQQVCLLLDESDFINSICILQNGTHAIQLGYKDNRWHLYDPNNDHRPTVVVMSFDSKESLVDEIVNILGNLLIINIVYTAVGECLPHHLYDTAIDLIKSQTQSVLLLFMNPLSYGAGLHAILESAPELISTALHSAISNIPFGKKEILIATSTQASSFNNCTGLQLLLNNAPEHFEFILENARLTPEGPQQILNAITTTNSSNWNGLYFILIQAPKQFTPTLHFAATSSEDKQKIAQALITPENLGWNSIHLAARNAEEELGSIFSYLHENLSEEKLFSACLSKTNCGWSGLHLIARCAPKQISLVFRYFYTSPQGREKLAEGLLAVVDNHTGLELVAEHGPSDLRNILNQLSSTSQIKSIKQNCEEMLKQRQLSKEVKADIKAWLYDLEPTRCFRFR